MSSIQPQIESTNQYVSLDNDTKLSETLLIYLAYQTVLNGVWLMFKEMLKNIILPWLNHSGMITSPVCGQ